jgi:hypothetical protein
MEAADSGVSFTPFTLPVSAAVSPGSQIGLGFSRVVVLIPVMILLALTTTAGEAAAPGRYLRCEELAGDVVHFMREARLIQDLSLTELSARPLVRDAIGRQPALLAVPSQIDPLNGLRQPNGDSTCTHVAVQGQCYMIRLLTYNPIAGQRPEKEIGR